MICKGQDLFGPCTKEAIKGTSYCNEHGGKKPIGAFGGRPTRVNDGSGYQIISVGFPISDIRRMKEAATADEVSLSEYIRRAVLSQMSSSVMEGE